MKVLVMVKGDPDPTDVDPAKMEAMFVAMGRYNEQLVEAGIMLDGAGLRNSRHGRRIAFEGGSTTVVDGPFGETKELLAGFWILDVKSKEEAIAWVKRIPNPDGTDTEIEIRKIFGTEDFDQSHPAIQDEYKLRELVERQNEARNQA